MPKPSFSSIPSEAVLFPADAPPATPHDTRVEFSRRGTSGYTKVRNSFVQAPRTAERGHSEPGTLSLFARNHRAAVLYLAVLTNWTWLSRGEEALPAHTWIRFLSCDDPRALTWTAQSLSHAWGVLENHKLITRVPLQRMKKVTPLNENATGEPYKRPEGAAGDTYFVLPAEFWTEELHGTLSWPALAVLLILLKETGGSPFAELAVDRAERYYGVSRTTAEKGLSELRARGLVASTERWVSDAEAGEGRRRASLHALLGPFSLEYRRGLQSAARSRRNKSDTTAPAKEVVRDEEAQAGEE